MMIGFFFVLTRQTCLNVVMVTVADWVGAYLAGVHRAVVVDGGAGGGRLVVGDGGRPHRRSLGLLPPAAIGVVVLDDVILPAEQRDDGCGRRGRGVERLLRQGYRG